MDYCQNCKKLLAEISKLIKVNDNHVDEIDKRGRKIEKYKKTFEDLGISIEGKIKPRLKGTKGYHDVEEYYRD